MITINEYREAIVQALLELRGEASSDQPQMREASARQLVNQLTDEELEDGIDFNTPSEIAEWLLEE